MIPLDPGLLGPGQHLFPLARLAGAEEGPARPGRLLDASRTTRVASTRDDATATDATGAAARTGVLTRGGTVEPCGAAAG